MITADEVRAQVVALVEEFGHLNVAAACMRTLAGYARSGVQRDAIEANELLRDEPLPGDELMRVAAPLRSALGKLLRAAGHQTFFTVVTVMALQYSLRGARAVEVDELTDPEGNPTCDPPPCAGCRERLASLRRVAAFRARSRDDRPQGAGGAASEGAA